MSSPSTTNRDHINLLWMVRLRWGAVLGQLSVVSVVHWVLKVGIHTTPLYVLIAVTAASNLLLARMLKQGACVTQNTIGMVTALDTLLLTGLLFFSGGPENPFNFLYLVHMALAAVMLQAVWMWSLLSLASACFLFLFAWHIPIYTSPCSPLILLFPAGVLVAFVLSAAFIVYFLHRTVTALRVHETALHTMQAQASRHERLSALATLAAGAAHELSTPLGTIAVVSKELERDLTHTQAQPTWIEDIQLIRTQVERCRLVLTQMAADAGSSTGEVFVPVTPHDLCKELVTQLSGAERVHIAYHTHPQAPTHHSLPLRGLGQALRGLVKNALEASPAQNPVHVVCHNNPSSLTLEITDTGWGMEAHVLTHVGEPFFTTKAPGQGMGLGVFLARTFVERLGGHMQFSSVQHKGTQVVVDLPCPPHSTQEQPHATV